MSLSGLDFAFGAGNEEYKNFRQISRDRLLNEMLRSPKVKESKTPWKVLIMDKFTVKIMSYALKMADITDAGISREAYIFFSSPVPKELVAYIKNDTSVVPRIGALSEMNLEYFTTDTQGFVTDHEMALEELFAENAEKSCKYNDSINVIATRIATALASMREFPNVRYRAAKSSDASETPHDLVPTKLATAVWDIFSKFKSTIPDYPQKETCELLIVDRSIDQIAPVIHEWTYDAMCHDLLDVVGNKYVHEVQNKSGATEKKEAILEDHDPVWLELRHVHIGDASVRLSDKMENFTSKNKAAQMQSKQRDEISTKDLQKVVQSLPQYTEQKERLSLHVEDLNPESKLRLLMIYALTYPEKFEGDKGEKLMQLAKLSRDDMNTVNNLRYLGGFDTKKKAPASFSLKFDTSNKKHAARKDRTGEEENKWAFSRFYPLVEELVMQISKNELSQQDYPSMNQKAGGSDGTAPAPVPNGSVRTHAPQPTGPGRAAPTQPVASVRSRRTPSWAKPQSDDGNSGDSVLRHASSDFRRMGQRIFVFMIGGATRSELRAAHKLTMKLKREVILGSTSLDDPPQFITKLKMLKAPEDSGNSKRNNYM
ncbi:hypothetical protein LUZ60_007249 [Juncus effusus]|nr:hypothetical protein LUZ60_007249 [Juncus effusus]